MTNGFNLATVPRLADCGIELLNSSDDNLGIALKPLHKLVCIVSTIHSTRLKRFIFRLRLSIKVMSVNNKHNLIHIVQFRYKLCCLERSQCFSGSCCMPYIAVIVRVLYTIQNLLYGIELIRTKHHQALVTLMQHDIFPYDFAKRTFFQEEYGKLIQFIERMIGSIRPIKCKLITAIGIIGKITGVYTI